MARIKRSDVAAALLSLGAGAALIAAPTAAMTPAMVSTAAALIASATLKRLIAAAAFKRLPAALLGLGRASAVTSFATRIAAASAPAAPITLVAVAPAGFQIALRNRAGNRCGFAQAEHPFQAAYEAEGLFDRSRRGLGRTKVVARPLCLASE